MSKEFIVDFDYHQLVAEHCKRSLKVFIEEFWTIVEPTTPLRWNWHHTAFVEHLEHIHQIRNLLINCPPGTSKSLILNVFFPCWRWTLDPGEKFLCATYSQPLSERDGLKARRIIESDKYKLLFPNVVLNSDQNTKVKFETTLMGYRQSVCTGGVSLGLKGNYCIIDDPHNACDGESAIARGNIVHWWNEAWYSRLCDMGKDCRIVCGQRIHREDLSGYLIDNFPDWTKLILPYEYKPTDYRTSIGWKDPRTQPGEPLWPERFPASELQNFRRQPVTWAAQWNQNPASVSAGVFNASNYRYYDETPDAYKCGETDVLKDNCFTLVSVDPAIGLSEHSDFTAIVVADVSCYGDIVIRQIYNERLGMVRLVPKLSLVNKLFEPQFILIEKGGLGTAIIQQAKATPDIRGKIKPIMTVRSQGEIDSVKVIRSLALQAAFERHEVYLPSNGATWVAAFEQQLNDFPNGRKDDMIDAAGYLATFAEKRTHGAKYVQEPIQTGPTQEELDKRLYERMWGD